MVHRVALLAELTQAVTAGEPSRSVAVRLCSAMAELVAADGAALSARSRLSNRLLVCATDESADALEDAQDVVGEGPTIDALRTRAAVTGLTLDAQRRRWPLLAEMVESRRGPLILHAFPVRSDAAVIGVISLYQTDHGSPVLDPELAQFLVDAVGGALLSSVDPGDVSHASWAARDAVAQATGMVAVQLDVAPVDALAVLRAHAFAHDTSVPDVSRGVVRRRLEFGAVGHDRPARS